MFNEKQDCICQGIYGGFTLNAFSILTYLMALVKFHTNIMLLTAVNLNDLSVSEIVPPHSFKST